MIRTAAAIYILVGLGHALWFYAEGMRLNGWIPYLVAICFVIVGIELVRKPTRFNVVSAIVGAIFVALCAGGVVYLVVSPYLGGLFHYGIPSILLPLVEAYALLCVSVLLAAGLLIFKKRRAA